MLVLALFACMNASDRTRPFPEGDGEHDVPGDRPGDTGATGDDTDGGGDTDTSGGDTDTSGGDTGDTGTSSGFEVCFLGPARDHTVCLPTVPYDAALMGADYDYPAPYDGSAQYAAPDRYVDLSAVDGGMDVAPNFALDELMSANKGRWGVVQAHLVDTLQAIRDDLGAPLVVNSGYRNPAYNAGVGGVEYSRHQYGDAVDLETANLTVEELGDVCTSFGADYVGLYEDGHTHCDWRDHEFDGAYWDVTKARRDGGASSRDGDVRLPTARLVRDGDAWTAPADGFDEGEPYRRWTAWNADGEVIADVSARSFVPPEGAVDVRVVVGGIVTLEAR